jgi:hypothetical protein
MKSIITFHNYFSPKTNKGSFSKRGLVLQTIPKLDEFKLNCMLPLIRYNSDVDKKFCHEVQNYF